MNELTAARLAHSAAQKTRNSFPIGARPDLDAEVTAAYQRVQDALAALKAQPRKVDGVSYRPCCAHAVRVSGSHYAYEANCAFHGHDQRGTCD